MGVKYLGISFINFLLTLIPTWISDYTQNKVGVKYLGIPFINFLLTLIPAWKSIYTQNKVGDEIPKDLFYQLFINLNPRMNK